MTGAMILRFSLLGIVFFIWAVLMFRNLFLLSGRARQRTGQMVAGPGAFLTEVGTWLRAPEDKLRRRNLGFLTVALTVMILTGALLGGR